MARVGEENEKLQRIVSKFEKEKGVGVGVILRGRYPHNHKLVLGTREQNAEGEWETDRVVEWVFESGKRLNVGAKGHFLNVYTSDEYEIAPRDGSAAEGGEDF